MKQEESKNNKDIKNKAAYKKPGLKPLGDIRDVTMGGSVGIGDSGAGGVEKPF